MNGRVGLPTAGFVPLDTVLAAIEGREAALTSAVYYRTVDPTGTRTSLNAWLRQAGFLAADGTLLPEAVAGTGEFAHAVYVNNFDLGFGRQMYTRTDELGNVFSFVKNYSTLEGAIRQLDSFATVVTEYSPLVNHTDPTPKFVKFFTFVEDGSGDAPRVASFDFDGRGERHTPGNCVVCHGGQRPPGVFGAHLRRELRRSRRRGVLRLADAQPRRRRDRQRRSRPGRSYRGTYLRCCSPTRIPPLRRRP